MFSIRKVLLWLWLILCGDFPVYELLAYSQTHCVQYTVQYSTLTVLTSLPCLIQWPGVCQTVDIAKLQLSTNPLDDTLSL